MCARVHVHAYELRVHTLTCTCDAAAMCRVDGIQQVVCFIKDQDAALWVKAQGGARIRGQQSTVCRAVWGAGQGVVQGRQGVVQGRVWCRVGWGAFYMHQRVCVDGEIMLT